ncbi:MAG: tetratricopeptide repeat protein [Chloroflexota bacterium]|nr:tetratricopeptide repeat protein [Chloroflexota bacterium]
MDERASFGPWLRQRRKVLRLTQEELAALISCSAAMVRKIEAGERAASQQMAELLAEVFGVVQGERPAFVQFGQGQLNTHAMERALWQTLHTAKAHLTNLPAPLTALVGRGRVLESLHKLLLLDSERLFTLTGPPGIGKTRLSLEVGAQLLDHFEDGVFFVSLAPIVDPDLVLTAIAHALGIPDKGAESLLATLQRLLSDKQMLLLLDNFEQVLDASPFVLELLGSCLHLKILITSREALHVYGEQQFPVPVLDIVNPENLPPVQVMMSIPSIALFLERARAVKSDFVLTQQNAGAVAAICARLDGLPLAIELAAAHVRLFSPREMQAYIDGRLPLLTGGPANLPARHRTLSAAIDWSYDLLNHGEQILFARLGVFVGGCTLGAAEAVCNARDDLAFNAKDGIESLLDKNLLKREEGVAGESRFTMLETLRDYAMRRLEGREETTVIGRLHTEYYLAFAEAFKLEMRGPNQVTWFRRVEQEQDNMKVALRWANANSETTLGLRLVLSLWWFWTVRGNVNEGGRWLEGLLTHGGSEPLLRAEALNAAGQVAWARGDLQLAASYLDESLALYNDLADRRGVGRTLRIIANLARDRGDYVRSRSYYERSLAILSDVGDTEGMALLLISMGENARYENDYDAAHALYERGMKISHDLGSKQLIAIILSNLGNLEHHEGHNELAEELFSESLQLQRELGERLITAECLAGLSSIARSEMQPNIAVKLLAAADQLLRSAGFQLNDVNRQDNDSELAEARKLVDPLIFDQLWAEGHAMTMQQAIDYALERPSIAY